jgi:hypothetical protein
VLLIDGVFHHALAVSSKETYEAAQHCSMSGAASMGALRGVECAPYGMAAVGTIAGWYRSGAIDGDDEVAVLVDPRAQRALSVPLVNVRFLMWMAVRRGVLDIGLALDVVLRARNIYYADRQWTDVFECAPKKMRNHLASIVQSGCDLKRLDARFALRRLVRDIAR